jgi:hypothetical protein
VIVLHEGCVRKSVRTKGLGKEARWIAMPRWRHQQDVRDLQSFNFHFRILIEFHVFSDTMATFACGGACVNSWKPPSLHGSFG